jgi:hypothetical protein
MKSLRNLAAMLAVPALFILFSPQVYAAPFIAGNIVVTQFGDGSATLAANATPVFVLEYLPSTAGQSGSVQTIAIPTNGASRLTVTGNSTSEGRIARSLNSTNLTFTGYDADAGTTGVNATTASAVNRCVGQLDFNGNFTRTAASSTAFSGSNTRSSVSDGTNYWMSGTASPTTTEGIWYSAGGTAPIQITTSPLVNTRVTRIFNGNLYYSVAASISAFSGLPTAATTATLTGITGSSLYEFAINPAGNVAYVADDSGVGGGVGGIAKWTNNGSIWAKAFTFGSSANTASNNLTAGCRGLAVDFSGANPVLYAVTADTLSRLIKITDTSALTATSDSADQAVILAIAPANTAFRGVALAPPSASTGTAPSITGISPSNLATNTGSTVTFTLTANVGYPTASNYWYKIVGTTTNLISSAPILTLNNVSTADTASYFVVLSNLTGMATSPVASLTVTAIPSISGISPSSVTTNAGSTVTFTLSANSGTPIASNFWYKIVGSTTNLIPSATTTTLTLSNVLGGDTANYFAILTNASGSATSAVVSLTVTGDPSITAQPASTFGLLDGTVQFAATAAGTSPSYQWYFSDTSGNIVAPVNNGTQGSGSVVSGANAGTLTINNLQLTDPTNFVVVVTNVYGAATSLVASLLSVTNTATLAFWNFDQLSFTNTLNSPAPWFGVGTAFAVNCTTLSGATDPADGPGFGLGSQNFSWGTTTYPANNADPALASNKLCGVQFNVSTVGAKNIKVSYDSRVSPTASDYERLQYTINGTDWIDYPASSTFDGQAGVGNAGYHAFNYSLIGFTGVANNPDFGIRVVTEFQSSASYGISVNSNYVGTANSYGTGGTVTYDIVNVSGDAITNNNTPPTISSFVNTNMVDTNSLTLNLTVGDLETPGALTVSAVSLNPSKVNPTFNYGGSGASRTLKISFSQNNFIPDPIDAAPILVTVTDGAGDSTATWFLLTVGSINLPPTSSLTALSATNTLANKSITIPFTVADDNTPVSGLTYSTNSNNNALVPSTNIVVNGIGTANPSVTITPAANQIGVAVVSVTVNDNDGNEPRSTTANIAFMVRPNTNVVAIDYFDYDTSGALDTVSGGSWTHLTGVFGQLQVGSGVATVDMSDNTENLQTSLLGAPYKTNSGAVLYASYIVNMDPARMPSTNGTYFTVFNDGSGVTGPYECRVLAATNGAAPGSYRIGIDNFGANAADGQMFPQDLSPSSNYVVVTALVLSNGFSTVWINPSSQSSPSVTDITSAPDVTNLYNIAEFELRESGGSGGAVNVSTLKVGTTFDSVFPSLHIQPAGTNEIVSWSDPTLGIQSTTNLLSPFSDVSGATPPYTNNAGINKTMFFRFGR